MELFYRREIANGSKSEIIREALKLFFEKYGEKIWGSLRRALIAMGQS